MCVRLCLQNDSKDEPALLEFIASVHQSQQLSPFKHKDVCLCVGCAMNDDDLQDEPQSVWEVHQADQCVLFLMHVGLLLCRPPSRVSCIAQKADTTKDIMLLSKQHKLLQTLCVTSPHIKAEKSFTED